jgi:hypothetical protein
MNKLLKGNNFKNIIEIYVAYKTDEPVMFANGTKIYSHFKGEMFRLNKGS